jgi:hypothetical protein
MIAEMFSHGNPGNEECLTCFSGLLPEFYCEKSGSAGFLKESPSGPATGAWYFYRHESAG